MDTEARFSRMQQSIFLEQKELATNIASASRIDYATLLSRVNGQEVSLGYTQGQVAEIFEDPAALPDVIETATNALRRLYEAAHVDPDSIEKNVKNHLDEAKKSLVTLFESPAPSRIETVKAKIRLGSIIHTGSLASGLVPMRAEAE